MKTNAVLHHGINNLSLEKLPDIRIRWDHSIRINYFGQSEKKAPADYATRARLLDCAGYAIWSIQVDLPDSALFMVTATTAVLICDD